MSPAIVVTDTLRINQFCKTPATGNHYYNFTGFSIYRLEKSIFLKQFVIARNSKFWNKGDLKI